MLQRHDVKNHQELEEGEEKSDDEIETDNNETVSVPESRRRPSDTVSQTRDKRRSRRRRHSSLSMLQRHDVKNHQELEEGEEKSDDEIETDNNETVSVPESRRRPSDTVSQ